MSTMSNITKAFAFKWYWALKNGLGKLICLMLSYLRSCPDKSNHTIAYQGYSKRISTKTNILAPSVPPTMNML